MDDTDYPFFDSLGGPGDSALKGRGNELFSLKMFDEAIGLDGQNAIFYDNRAASYWALQRFVEGVLLLPQLFWADDAKKVDLCVRFFASSDR